MKKKRKIAYKFIVYVLLSGLTLIIIKLIIGIDNISNTEILSLLAALCSPIIAIVIGVWQLKISEIKKHNQHVKEAEQQLKSYELLYTLFYSDVICYIEDIKNAIKMFENDSLNIGAIKLHHKFNSDNVAKIDYSNLIKIISITNNKIKLSDFIISINNSLLIIEEIFRLRISHMTECSSHIKSLNSAVTILNQYIISNQYIFTHEIIDISNNYIKIQNDMLSLNKDVFKRSSFEYVETDLIIPLTNIICQPLTVKKENEDKYTQLFVKINDCRNILTEHRMAISDYCSTFEQILPAIEKKETELCAHIANLTTIQ